ASRDAVVCVRAAAPGGHARSAPATSQGPAPFRAVPGNVDVGRPDRKRHARPHRPTRYGEGEYDLENPKDRVRVRGDHTLCGVYTYHSRSPVRALRSR